MLNKTKIAFSPLYRILGTWPKVNKLHNHWDPHSVYFCSAVINMSFYLRVKIIWSRFIQVLITASLKEKSVLCPSRIRCSSCVPPSPYFCIGKNLVMCHPGCKET